MWPESGSICSFRYYLYDSASSDSSFVRTYGTVLCAGARGTNSHDHPRTFYDVEIITGRILELRGAFVRIPTRFRDHRGHVNVLFER